MVVVILSSCFEAFLAWAVHEHLVSYITLLFHSFIMSSFCPFFCGSWHFVWTFCSSHSSMSERWEPWRKKSRVVSTIEKSTFLPTLGPLCHSTLSAKTHGFRSIDQDHCLAFSFSLHHPILEMRIRTIAYSPSINLSWFLLILGWRVGVHWRCNSSSSLVVFVL